MLTNKRTQAAYDAFVNHPAGALIVAGSQSSGTREIIEQLKADILTHADRHSVLTVSRGTDTTIGVEKIRELKQWLTTRFSKHSAIARIIVIEDSELMTHEAQNALLKVLEEPSADTLIILESSERIRLLDTIRSRCQILKVLPLEKETALQAANESGAQTHEAAAAYALSGGEAVLFEQLIAQEATDLVEKVSKAKEFLKLSTFERLKMQPEYAQPQTLSDLVVSLTRVCEAAMTQPAANVGRWAELLRVVKRSETLLDRNTAPKLIYTFISVNL